MTHSYETCKTWLTHIRHDSSMRSTTHLCSVLQCVAVCCSVLQCVAVCCRVLQCVAVCCRVLQCVAVCCSERHDSFIWVWCFVSCFWGDSCLHMGFVTHNSFIWKLWNMTHRYEAGLSHMTCNTWLIHMRRDSCMRETTHSHESEASCDMTHSCVWRNSLECVTRRTHFYDDGVLHIFFCMWSASWLYYMCDMTHSMCAAAKDAKDAAQFVHANESCRTHGWNLSHLRMCHTTNSHNTLQHAAIHYSLQHTATTDEDAIATHVSAHCNTLQHAATRCNTLQHNTRIP